MFSLPGAPNQAGGVHVARGELRFRTTDQIVAIGASTGGTEAVRQVLQRLPPDTPGIVITQHIPRAFSAPFAARLNACSQLSVQEAQDGALIVPGHAYIAPGDRHLTVERDGARYRCRLRDDAPVNRHRPSVDVLFRSVAEQVGPNAVGVILTGMGVDGARGLKEMRGRGAHTIAQDEKSSVVWGMPGASVALGAVDRILPIEQIAAGLVELGDSREERLAAGS
jgi:two-component system chemotaxis response regulator CheB